MATTSLYDWPAILNAIGAVILALATAWACKHIDFSVKIVTSENAKTGAKTSSFEIIFKWKE